MTTTLHVAATTTGVDAKARTITGLLVPFGKAGGTSGGRLTFAKGALTWSDPKRVKLLREHDQTSDVIGYATELVETDAGVLGTFAIPAGFDAGDKALAEAEAGLRDGLSVGVELDDSTYQRMRRSQGAPVAGAGALREVSLVSVPAYDDARLAASGALVIASWHAIPQTAGAAAGTTTGGTMPDQQQPTTEPAPTTPSTPPAVPGDPAVPGEPTVPGDGQQGDQGGLATASARPGTVPARGGAARVTSEPATYSFDGSGPSVVADLYNAHMRRDSEAGERVETFNQQLAAGEPAALHTFAVATRDDVDGSGTDLMPGWGAGTTYRPDLMRQLVDVKRPILSRVQRVPISNAQPFAIPTVGEFTGVGDHTEGTPHRPAGTLTIGAGDAVQPKATSGAWEVSRELLDAANPVLDRVAARAMLRDYQRQSEGKFVTLLDQLAATAGAHVYNVSSVMGLRNAMQAFVNDDDEPADLVGLGKGLAGVMLNDVDNDDRPQLPYLSPVNAVGTVRAGYLGFAIDGVEVFRAAKLDAGITDANVAGNVGVIARSEGLLWAESNVLQFRFDEVLGPGVVKLALWAYNGAAILDTADVAILNSGADPTP